MQLLLKTTWLLTKSTDLRVNEALLRFQRSINCLATLHMYQCLSLSLSLSLSHTHTHTHYIYIYICYIFHRVSNVQCIILTPFLIENEAPYLPSNGLSSTMTVHVQKWLWRWLTHKVLYAIKPTKATKSMKYFPLTSWVVLRVWKILHLYNPMFRRKLQIKSYRDCRSGSIKNRYCLS